MKKIIASVGLAAAVLVGGGSAAFAAYPADAPGTLKIDQPDCEIEQSGNENDFGAVRSTGFTVHYDVTAADTTLTISDFSGAIITRAVPIGSGEVVVKWGDPGFDLTGAMHMFYTARLESNGATVSAEIRGCPIPTVDGKDSGDNTATGNKKGKTSISSAASNKKSSGSKGSLPETGSNTLALSMIAVGLLAVGVSLVQFGRRNEATNS